MVVYFNIFLATNPWYLKKQININVTTFYFTDTAVANKNIYLLHL